MISAYKNIPVIAQSIIPFRDARSKSLTIESLFIGAPIERFKRKASIFTEGSPADKVYSVVGGVVRKIKILGDGRRVVSDFVFPGEILGFLAKGRTHYTAEAATPLRLRCLSRANFDDAINGSEELRPLLLARVCNKIAATQEQMVLLGSKTAEERVSQLLLTMARRYSRHDAQHLLIEIPMTRQDLADYLGLTIETVSRTMTRLINSGVIAPRGRHTIAICKFDDLVSLAGESPGFLPALIGFR
jgi:CRP/FNR family transcriptional regulator